MSLRRSSWGSAVLCALGLLLSSAGTSVAGDADNAVSTFRMRIGEAESALGDLPSDAPSDTVSRIRSAVSNLTAQRMTLESQAMELGNLESEVASLKSTAQFKRIEWESALGKYKQAVAARDHTIEQWTLIWNNHQAAIKEHNAREGAAKTESQRFAYNREAEQLNAKSQRLKGEKAKVLAEKGGEVVKWRTEASKREKDFRLKDAEAKRKEMAWKAGTAKVVAAANAGAASAAQLAAAIRNIRVVRVVRPPRTPWRPSMRPPPARTLPPAGRTTATRVPPALRKKAFVFSSARDDDEVGKLSEELREAGLAASLRRYKTGVPEKTVEAPATQDSTKLVLKGSNLAGIGAADASGQLAGGLSENARVDESQLISRSTYVQAEAEAKRLRTLEEKLVAKLAEVEGWGEDLQGHLDEFEALRKEALKGGFSDLLSAVPPGKTLQLLAKGAKGLKEAKGAAGVIKGLGTQAEKVLTPELIQVVQRAEDHLKLHLGAAEFAGSEDLPSGVSAGAGVTADAVAALGTAIGQLPPDDPLARKLAAIQGTLKVGGTVTAYMLRSGERDPAKEREQLEDAAKTLAEIGATLVPAGAVASGVVKTVERGASVYVIQGAMRDIDAGLSKNFEAKEFLAKKIDHTKRWRTEMERTTGYWERSHPTAR